MEEQFQLHLQVAAEEDLRIMVQELLADLAVVVQVMVISQLILLLELGIHHPLLHLKVIQVGVEFIGVTPDTLEAVVVVQEEQVEIPQTVL